MGDDWITGGVLHGGRVYRAAERWGVNPHEILDFSANINPMGPPPGVRRALAEAQAALGLYPDVGEFVAALSAHLDISPEDIVVGSGSTALIFAAIRALRPRRALILEPAFGEYHRALRAGGVSSDVFLLKEQNAFLPDFAHLQALLESRRYDVLFLNTPHNPSGVVYPVEQVLALTDIAEPTRTVLIMDEAFIDYVPQASRLSELVARPHVIVVRSLTKFYAMPGLRIGYGVCTPTLARRLREQIEAWPVSDVALRAARAALSDTAYQQRARDQNRRARSQLAAALGRLPGVTVFPSRANFLLIKLAGRRGRDLARWLEPYRILIRRCDSFTGLGDQFVRLAIRSPADNRRLVKLMEQWLRGSENDEA